jgi:hypothetical protein
MPDWRLVPTLLHPGLQAGVVAHQRQRGLLHVGSSIVLTRTTPQEVVILLPAAGQEARASDSLAHVYSWGQKSLVCMHATSASLLPT